ncbi:mechanosensitive ion channel family protein [Telluribacter sp. SYSU D00476]|uniref:mechanosensitive ion channel family protein n=1 Tax=Telluribacter sp. SYSU D00476 TaxID=2811430 RepID=UPI001FF264C2|nr:mechanosensitive ion channel family protein [Telluribacter sp. SYSU D00476]
MFDDLEILEKVYFRNSVLDYIIAFGSILLGVILVALFKRVILRKVEKLSGNTATHVDDYLVHGMERFGVPALYITVIYSGLTYLTLSRKIENILRIGITVVVTYLAIRIVSTIILMLLHSYVRRQERGEEKVKQLGGLMIVINIVIWGVGLLSLLDNLGYDVTTVIAGLGIGGVAIALASQNILGDLFNYFVIFFDRPFEAGDFIIIDNKMGVIDYIGVKSTRIKSLTGEQLIFSNSDLTKSRIHNYKRMERRRILFKFGVVYQTSLENLKLIPQVVKSIITSQDNTTFDRAHFAAYGDSSLDFEVVYFVLSSDYNVYMDIQQTINLRMYEEFQKMGVEFAYPTRTLYLTNHNGEPRKEKRENGNGVSERPGIIHPD